MPSPEKQPRSQPPPLLHPSTGVGLVVAHRQHPAGHGSYPASFSSTSAAAGLRHRSPQQQAHGGPRLTTQNIRSAHEPELDPRQMPMQSYPSAAPSGHVRGPLKQQPFYGDSAAAAGTAAETRYRSQTPTEASWQPGYRMPIKCLMHLLPPQLSRSICISAKSSQICQLALSISQQQLQGCMKLSSSKLTQQITHMGTQITGCKCPSMHSMGRPHLRQQISIIMVQ